MVNLPTISEFLRKLYGLSPIDDSVQLFSMNESFLLDGFHLLRQNVLGDVLRECLMDLMVTWGLGADLEGTRASEWAPAFAEMAGFLPIGLRHQRRVFNRSA